MVPIQLLLLFYRREASEPYVLSGPSIKQYKSGPDPCLRGAPKCPGKHFRVCAGYAPSTFLELVSWACCGASAEIIFYDDLIHFTRILQVFYWFWAKAIVDTWGVRRHMRRTYIYIYGVPLFFFRGVRRHRRRIYIYIYIYIYIHIYIYICEKRMFWG